MSFDANSILASLLVSSIGFVVFSYGRKQVRPPQVITGIVLMVFPYFVPGVILMLVVAAVLLVGLWGAVRLGW